MSPTLEQSFFERVYEVARQIPYGRVTTYGAIARSIGAPNSARMVGWAMNHSLKQEPPVPAHRVVNRHGVLTGKKHFNPPQLMEELLTNEGIEIQEDQIVNFEKHFWDPGPQLTDLHSEATN